MVFVSNTVKHSLMMNDHRARASPQERSMPRYTEKQGQYLAFIYYYTKIHGRSPSEAESHVSSVLPRQPGNQLVRSLEKTELIPRTEAQPRPIELLYRG